MENYVVLYDRLFNGFLKDFPVRFWVRIFEKSMDNLKFQFNFALKIGLTRKSQKERFLILNNEGL